VAFVRQSRTVTTGTALMTGKQIARFVQHYERITCHILDEMPARADLLVRARFEARR
jgi:D-glycerate 3-kinase